MRSRLRRQLRRDKADRLRIGLLIRQVGAEPRREDGRIGRAVLSAFGHSRRGPLLPDRTAHGIGLVRIHQPRREEIIAQEPFEQSEVTRVTAGRGFEKLIDGTGGDHRGAKLFAHGRKARNLRQAFALRRQPLQLDGRRIGSLLCRTTGPFRLIGGTRPLLAAGDNNAPRLVKGRFGRNVKDAVRNGKERVGQCPKGKSGRLGLLLEKVTGRLGLRGAVLLDAGESLLFGDKCHPLRFGNRAGFGRAACRMLETKTRLFLACDEAGRILRPQFRKASAQALRLGMRFDGLLRERSLFLLAGILRRRQLRHLGFRPHARRFRLGPSNEREAEAMVRKPVALALEVRQVLRALVDLFELALAFLEFAKSLEERLERVARGILKELTEEFVIVCRTRGDLAVGLARAQELAHVGVFLLAAEKAFPDSLRIVVDVRIGAAAGEIVHPFLEFARRRGAFASVLRDRQRKVSDRDGGESAPALDGDVHAFGGKADGEGKRAARIGREFQRGIRDAGLAIGTPRHRIVAEDDALIAAAARILRPGDTCGRIELHIPSGGEDEMDCIKERRLSRSVVAQEEEVSALGKLHGRRPEVMELDQPNGGHAVILASFHKFVLHSPSRFNSC